MVASLRRVASATVRSNRSGCGGRSEPGLGCLHLGQQCLRPWPKCVRQRRRMLRQRAGSEKGRQTGGSGYWATRRVRRGRCGWPRTLVSDTRNQTSFRVDVAVANAAEACDGVEEADRAVDEASHPGSGPLGSLPVWVCWFGSVELRTLTDLSAKNPCRSAEREAPVTLLDSPPLDSLRPRPSRCPIRPRTRRAPRAHTAPRTSHRAPARRKAATQIQVVATLDVERLQDRLDREGGGKKPAFFETFERARPTPQGGIRVRVTAGAEGPTLLRRTSVPGASDSPRSQGRTSPPALQSANDALFDSVPEHADRADSDGIATPSVRRDALARK